MNQGQRDRDKLVYLRQWVGDRVSVTTVNNSQHVGQLTNIVFDGTRLMYIMIDDLVCINFDHTVEIRVAK